MSLGPEAQLDIILQLGRGRVTNNPVILITVVLHIITHRLNHLFSINQEILQALDLFSTVSLQMHVLHTETLDLDAANMGQKLCKRRLFLY